MKLRVACGDYDRTAALKDGSVRPMGLELEYISAAPGEFFGRQAQTAEFEVAEFSLSTLMLLHSRGDDRLVALPIFPSRMFRHSFIFVNTESGITKPTDLIGRQVGCAQYQNTAGLWIRGILQHEYGVTPYDIEWWLGTDRVPLNLPSSMKVHRLKPGETLDELLKTGAIDAIISPRVPPSLVDGSGKVRRLFNDYRNVEAEYFLRTEFFPIMHTVVLRSDIYTNAPWAALHLYQAFQEAKAIGAVRLRESGALYCSLPWLLDEIDKVNQLMGPDPWQYGLQANHSMLRVMADYAFEQGLLSQPLADVSELFAPETRST